jgi:hypothetical protein
MKRLVAATIVLSAIAVGAQAGGLPKAPRLVDRIKNYHQTHYIRGQESGQPWGLMSGAKSTAEAREEAKPAKPQKPGEKEKPAPKRAD